MKRKVLSLVLMLCLIVCSFSSTLNVVASDYDDEIADIEAKKAAVRSQISSLKEDINKQNELKASLQSEIDLLQQEIDIYNGQITEFNNKIYELEARKKVVEEDLNANKNVFLERIRAMYISGSTNNDLSVLLGAESFGDYLYQSELLERVTKNDNQILDELKADILEIEKLENEVNEQKAQVLPFQQNVQAKQDELNNTMKEYNAIIAELEGEQSELEGTLDEYNSQIADLESRIRQSLSGDNDSPEYYPTNSNGEFTWPCPDYYYVSSPFGPRWGSFHSGIDIAGSGIYGAPIVAAADGYVSISENNYGGYGEFILIKHDDKYSTAYGHMSARAVSGEQYVVAGQVIGYVGNTGWSTGPHLHFEIRIYGEANDPLAWF